MQTLRHMTGIPSSERETAICVDIIERWGGGGLVIEVLVLGLTVQAT